MDIQAFTFNKVAKYAAIAGPRSNLTASDLTMPTVQVTKSDTFQATFPDVFQKYVLPKVSSNQLIQAWYSNPMQWWQNQLNFAVWCATTGCGVSGKITCRLRTHKSAPCIAFMSTTRSAGSWRRYRPPSLKTTPGRLQTTRTTEERMSEFAVRWACLLIPAGGEMGLTRALGRRIHIGPPRGTT